MSLIEEKSKSGSVIEKKSKLGSVMHGLYKGLFALISPLLKGYFYARCWTGKDEPENVRNHFGEATLERPEGRLMWVHAVSIGESTAALTFINHVKEQFPNLDLNVLITTITTTSAGILRPKIAKIPRCYHQFGVADNPAWVRKFLEHWRPDVAVFLESEIWPNTVDELHRRGIPTFLLNARLSPRSFKRWKLVKGFLGEVLQKFTGILAQSEADREKYSFFSPKNTKVIDNLKYANPVLPCNEDLLEKMREMCREKAVFVAASTHEGEEEIILEAHKKLREKYDLVTVIIPRHLTRVKRVCEIIEKHGEERFVLRSKIEMGNDCSDKIDIVVVDTFGEVGTFFRIADICFVGGSLVPIGGHNLHEPVALGKPVLHGIHTENCREIKDMLASAGVAFEVKNAEEIYDVCNRLLSRRDELGRICERCLATTKNDALKQIDAAMQLSDILKEKWDDGGAAQ